MIYNFVTKELILILVISKEFCHRAVIDYF